MPGISPGHAFFYGDIGSDAPNHVVDIAVGLTESESVSIGKNIRALRQRKKLTQAELAKRIRVAKSTLNDWENEVMDPRMGRLPAIAAALDASVQRLLA
jgi:DNA-binding XRE family transcriptional regulator